jgi:hypothetical protein
MALEAWKTETDFSKRDAIYAQLKESGVRPEEAIAADEHDGALYPDTNDAQFLNKLLRKREFAESKAAPFEILKEGDPNPCETGDTFEITPVQKFISNFMSPDTPYNSALLYHGTGVGKTQAAIQIAEGFLEKYPRKKIIIVAPGTIQPGFYRNIFDISRITIGTGSEPNTANQGTNDLYMRITGTLYERDKAKIERKVTEAIRRRYSFFGYLAFRNSIRKLIERKGGKSTKRKSDLEIINRILREEYSDRVLIIDEAHHLREEETAAEQDEELDTVGAGGKADVDDSSAGGKLVPFLKQLLAASEGMKLILMTATPMYNTATEIITLLNLLILNDKKIKDALIERVFFDAAGNLREDSPQIALLYNAASSYISYMRGENPRTFPVRLYPDPKKVYMVSDYPEFDPGGQVAIDPTERRNMGFLPLVQSDLDEDGFSYMMSLYEEEISDISRASGRYGIAIRDRLIQAGNVLFPVDGMRYGETGFSETFRREGSGIATRFHCREDIAPDWLAEENLSQFSPKAGTILNQIRSSRNVQFIYSRFVPTGALFLALVLEANGYTLVGRQQSLFADGIQSEGGRQCALCEMKERTHTVASHGFTPAKYVLLTGSEDISPKNSDSIAMARGAENVDGRNVKVVIGSQVAAEGVDLRFIREIHIFDSWYHLNKTDQVIGRGIRYCSHSMLPLVQRNCTIYLHVIAFPGENFESIDMYSYRLALKKARQVGVVARIIKQHALDCNLNKSAVQIVGQENITVVDSQGQPSTNVNINDAPFSPICDWLEKCEYVCKPEVNIDITKLDESTYDEFSARHIELDLKNRIKRAFADTSFYYGEDFLNLFKDVSPQALGFVLDSVLDNKNFHLRHKDIDGYLIYKNGFFLFQPSILKDETIPLVLRTTFFPIRKDEYTPEKVTQIAVEDLKVTEPEEEENIESKWTTLTEWMKGALEGTYGTVTEEVKRLVKNMTTSDPKKNVLFNQILSALILLPGLFKKKQMVLEACQEYFFDEWLTQSEREKVTIDGTDMGAASENRVSVGSLKILRFVNVKTGQIEYKKEEDGSSVPKSVLDILLSRKDAVTERTATIGITGSVYGFITTKAGKAFVFKQGLPLAAGKKPASGAECAITSETANKKKNLDAIAEIYGTGNIDTVVLGHIKNLNATQLCAVTNIFLRVMDKQAVNRVRWFFRPIAAAASGHKGKA